MTVITQLIRSAPHWVLLGMLASLMSACSKPRTEPQPAAGTSAAAAQGLERGERVVVESAAAEFFEARVLEVGADRIRVQVHGTGDTRSVAVGDVYRRAATAAVASGKLGICRLKLAWRACRVLSARGAESEVESADAERFVISSADVLAPTALTELNIERHFARATERRDFGAELRRAGRPRPPSGWKASPHETVVARKEDGWFSGTVFELGDEEHRIHWSGSARTSDVRVSDVVPLPRGSSGLKRGDFALARPVSPASPWQPIRVESVSEDVVHVRDVDGNRRSTTLSDLLPLRP